MINQVISKYRTRDKNEVIISVRTAEFSCEAALKMLKESDQVIENKLKELGYE